MKSIKNIVKFILSFGLVAGAFAAEDGEILGQYGAITVKYLNGKKTAIFDADSKETVEIPQDVVVDSFYYDRNFSGVWGKPATIMFPFAIANSCMSSWAGIYQLDSIVSAETWSIFASYVSNTEANTPYFLRVHSDYISLGNYCYPITLNTTTGGNKIHDFGPWEFTGTYSYKAWETGDSELGYVYGFAAKEKEVDGKLIQAGQFVKGKAGAYIRPLRAYLIYNPKKKVLSKGAADVTASLTAEDLPTTIDVIFLDENGETTAIHSLNTYTGEFSNSTTGWYDMKGRKLDKKPTIKGNYFYNGKKVSIK